MYLADFAFMLTNKIVSKAESEATEKFNIQL